MRPERDDIGVPPLPAATEWIVARPPAIERLAARGPVLVHFLCALDLNSVRTLPYLRAWHERYAEHGLSVLGVNSPRFPPSAEGAKLSAALDRLAIGFPVALDADYGLWRAYGCRGWPSLFLWGRGGTLRWYHFGEGEYRATEEEIQGLLAAGRSAPRFPSPLEPIRPSDAPGARVMPPTREILPGGSTSEPWTPTEAEEGLALDYAAGGVAASVDGAGALHAALDGGEERAIEVSAPGVYELATHARHEHHRLSLRAQRGARIWSIGFAAGVP